MDYIAEGWVFVRGTNNPIIGDFRGLDLIVGDAIHRSFQKQAQ